MTTPQKWTARSLCVRNSHTDHPVCFHQPRGHHRLSLTFGCKPCARPRHPRQRVPLRGQGYTGVPGGVPGMPRVPGLQALPRDAGRAPTSVPQLQTRKGRLPKPGILPGWGDAKTYFLKNIIFYVVCLCLYSGVNPIWGVFLTHIPSSRLWKDWAPAGRYPGLHRDILPAKWLRHLTVPAPLLLLHTNKLQERRVTQLNIMLVLTLPRARTGRFINYSLIEQWKRGEPPS